MKASNKDILKIIGSSIVVLAIIGIFFFCQKTDQQGGVVKIWLAAASISTPDNPNARNDYELAQLVDPATGELPPNIFQLEREFVNHNFRNTNLRKETQDWQFSGPTNLGGRTRALALDVRNENTIIAGGVSGGMYRSTNGGQSWTRSSHPNSLNSATCVAQDTRSGKGNTWYHGTGELRGSSASANGAPYRGDGIFKSEDGGVSWNLLPATSNGNTSLFNSPFRYVWNIVTNPTKSNVDEVYAAVFGGIIRSQDGGNSWHTVLGDDLLSGNNDLELGGTDHPQFTNVAISSGGIFYATIGSFTAKGFKSGKSGIFKSTDGDNWERISPLDFPTNVFRIVIGIAPSDESKVYFLMDSQPNHQLWLYDEKASISNFGRWTDLSDNIPKSDNEYGGYDSQNSYNMLVKVHPTSPSIVFMGGTNLYRSTDGFKSSDNTQWIGGYKPDGSGAIYPGHYADQHELVFYPSNPNKMLSANDGGVRLTNNNLASEPEWVSLNNGYNTSQFYTIAQDKLGGSKIAGGLQDNGSYLKTIPDDASPWINIVGGDGGYMAFTKSEELMYFSFQNSQILRITTNRNTQITSFTRVDPTDGGSTPGQGYLFINPFVLDPHNTNRMYMAGGDRLWRNNNLIQIPSSQKRKTAINWDNLISTRVSNGVISALAISSTPADIIYYGTSGGELYKLENASIGSPRPTFLNSTTFRGEGYIICIAIDPTDADHIIVVMSNYNVISLFRSFNGGKSFENISANLEENPDGTGNGPSTRWATIVPKNNQEYEYFIGTSSGIFSAAQSKSNNVIWQQEATETIGNSVVPMLDYRTSDGRLVVGTHGNGAFETFVKDASIFEFESSESVLEKGLAYPNPFSTKVNIPFSLSRDGQVQVSIYDLLGRQIANIFDGKLLAGKNAVSWDGTGLDYIQVAPGIYIYKIEFEKNILTGKVIFYQK
jgi:hypothetical protein